MFQPNQGDRSNIQNYLVIFTDGKSNNREETWQEAMRARNEVMLFYIISNWRNEL